MRIKRIKWVPLLMIISQLMLTGFVAFWLTSQYKDEKLLLGDDISRIYKESQSQVIDSLLFNWVVEPALKDSVSVMMATRTGFDIARGLVYQKGQAKGALQIQGAEKNATVAIALNDSLVGKKDNPLKTIAIRDNKQDLLIRSVKLIISHSDADTAAGPDVAFVTEKPDTILFKKIFYEKLDKKGLGVTFIWHADTAAEMSPAHRTQVTAKSGMYFTSRLPGDLPGVQINHDFQYLIFQIIPQILFALILLLLTGSAFFFTNRSLNRQLMLNSLRNDFVSNITHELKTPVSTVKVALEALKTFDKVSDPVVTRDYLDMAASEMNRLDQLIGKVLDQSLIGEQNHIIEPRLSSLRDLTISALSNLQPRLDARKAVIHTDYSGLEDLVSVDPLHFQGVLTNLIDNSLKYGPELPVIGIRLFRDDASALVEVCDNGPGIPKAFIGRVFDRFFRVPTGDVHNIKGYGLGLSFAALVMKQHHGSISVINLPDGGCAFTLRFPLRKA